MNIYLLNLFRLIHVVAGILWAGAAISYIFFVKPSVQSIGVAGPQLMHHLMQRRKYPAFMMGTSLLTILAGVPLLWFISGGLNLRWITSGPGLGFTIGSLAALIAFFVGGIGIGPTSEKMVALGKQIVASDKGPLPEQIDQMQALEKRLSLAERIDFIMLAIAMLTMATARYWAF